MFARESVAGAELGTFDTQVPLPAKLLPASSALRFSLVHCELGRQWQ